MKQIQIHQVDAFTNVAFGGNPAGVVPDARGLTEDEMQKIAREMALSETAFVTPGTRPGQFVVRFFTPSTEVNLCGHATIGTFFHLAEAGVIDRAPEQQVTRVHQVTKAGELAVDIFWTWEGGPERVMMEQNPPERLATYGKPEEIAEIASMLGASPDVIGATQGAMTPLAESGCPACTSRALVPQVISTGLPDLIVPIKSRKALWALKPDLNRVADWSRAHGVISVHAVTLDPIDPVHTGHCRDFSPAVAVPEEAATGTASGATSGYLVLNGVLPAAPVARIVLEQGDILKRPSLIHCEVRRGSPAEARCRAWRGGEHQTGHLSVWVGGSAVTVLSGTMRF
jgi:trans-2,3-dihydro-3-hydroxyanthranilate isomerase